MFGLAIGTSNTFKEFDLTGRMWLVLYHLRLILFSSTTDITNIFVIIYEDIQRLLSGL